MVSVSAALIERGIDSKALNSRECMIFRIIMKKYQKTQKIFSYFLQLSGRQQAYRTSL